MNYYLKKEINQTLHANFKKITKDKKSRKKDMSKFAYPCKIMIFKCCLKVVSLLWAQC